MTLTFSQWSAIPKPQKGGRRHLGVSPFIWWTMWYLGLLINRWFPKITICVGKTIKRWSCWIHLGKAPGIPQSEKPTSCRLLDRIALKGHHGRNPQNYLELHMAPISCSTPSLQVGQLLSGPQNLEISGWNPPRWGGVHTQPSTEKWKKISEILPWWWPWSLAGKLGALLHQMVLLSGSIDRHLTALHWSPLRSDSRVSRSSKIRKRSDPTKNAFI